MESYGCLCVRVCVNCECAKGRVHCGIYMRVCVYVCFMRVICVVRVLMKEMCYLLFFEVHTIEASKRFEFEGRVFE